MKNYLLTKEDVHQLLESIIGKPFNAERMAMAYDFYNEIFNFNCERYGNFIRHEKIYTKLHPCNCHYDVLDLLAVWSDYYWKK